MSFLEIFNKQRFFISDPARWTLPKIKITALEITAFSQENIFAEKT